MRVEKVLFLAFLLAVMLVGIYQLYEETSKPLIIMLSATLTSVGLTGVVMGFIFKYEEQITSFLKDRRS